MEKTSLKPGLKVLVLLSFAAMLAVNALANILPINGIGTGAVSDSYPNLFAPAGLTFSIWGVIYLLLAVFTLYVLGLFRGKEAPADPGLLPRISLLFAVSSLANTAWIFSWHYKIIPLSMVLMACILICLIAIMRALQKASLSPREAWLMRLPFSVYFGWITVATIANATTLLVDLKWDRFGLSEALWTVAVLAVGTLIGGLTTVLHKDVAYGLVFLWAYAGILLKHIANTGFNGQYGQVVLTAIVCLVLLAGCTAAAAIRGIKDLKAQ